MMDKYLKMADVFDCDVSDSSFVIGDSIYNAADLKHCLYAAHAINSHDYLVAEVERLRGALEQCAGALYIAHKFCGNHTADECGDEIAIPISDALVVASKLVAP